LQDLESQLVITITPSLEPDGGMPISALPNGTNTIAYPTIYFTASGASGSYTMTNAAPLPEGLSFYNGVLSGTPVANAVNVGENYGTYSISIELTDSIGRTVTINYPINIYQPPSQ
ncbi:MAG: putative Ig domain-containing protein, partial [Limisphaerales bacterium]